MQKFYIFLIFKYSTGAAALENTNPEKAYLMAAQRGLFCERSS
jgi:hypothetical protein